MSLNRAPYQFLTSPEDQLPGMKLDWLTLAFVGRNAHLEPQFLGNYSMGSLQLQRVAVFFGSLMVAAFGFMDVLVLEGALDIILAIRYGLLVPMTLAFLIYTLSPHFRQHAQLSITFMVTFMGFGLSAIVLVAPVEASPLYFAGNLLVIFFAYAFLGLRFIWANIAGWSIVLGFTGADLVLGRTEFEEQFMRTFFTSSTCLLGMFVAYSTEFSSRRDFYLRHVLEKRRAELELSRNELEERVNERTEQALAAVKAKTDFLANMSHEIRTPMNGVLGMLELLQASDLSVDQKEKIDTAFNSAEGLLDIINDVLDLSKIEAGKMKIRKESISPALIIEDVVSLMAPQFRAKKLKLVNELEPESYGYFLMDSTRLRQIILNLVGNALKFTDKGVVKIDCRVREQTLIIEIEDTGIGILNEQRQHLFDAFSQVDNSSAREFGGTGLGLSISKQLTELMQGSIAVKSSFSVGSVFTLTFPAEPCADQQRPVKRSSIYKKVFYVVESEHYSRSVRLMLKTLGCTISRLDEAEIAITDMDSIDCGNLPTLFLGEADQSSGAENPGANTRTQSLRFPFTLSALASALSNSNFAPDIEALQNPEKKFSDRRVLLVEDNIINQKVACSMMRKLAVDADTAMSGQEALMKLENQHYDLIFMDCQMPGMDGFETTQAIRRLEQQQNLDSTIIVALTANAMEGDRQRCLDAGMNDYISKPISLAGMVQVFDRWKR